MIKLSCRDVDPIRKGQIAFGEKVSNGRLKRRMTEGEAIDAMIRLRTQGYSYRQIAAWLDAKGVKTKNRRGRWQATTVMKILRRKTES